MRGKKEFKPKQHYAFSLDDAIPKDHLLRRLDAILDLSFIDELTEDLYGYNGNVSIDPVVVVKVLLLDFLYNIGGVRETIRQVEDRLSFRWFIGYDIDEDIFDHSAISKNLKRFGAYLFKEMFDRSVRQCIRNGLVGGKLVHIDSTTVKADASVKSVHHKRPADKFHPHIAPREYWDKVNKAAKKEHPNVNDRIESTTDPDSSIHSHDGKKLGLYYKDHRAADDKHGVIIATQATGAEVTDEKQFKPLLNGIIFGKQLLPETVAADTIYGCAENHKELIDKGIEPNIPHVRSPGKKGVFNKDKFTYIPEKDIYICPAGNTLHPPSNSETKRRRFRAYAADCADCELRSKCTTAKGPRTIKRHSDEAYVEQALQHRDTPKFHYNMGRRMAVVEGGFGDAKEYRGHRQAQWRGLEKMQIQCYLVATAQNLKKLLKYAWKDADSVANQCKTIIFALFRDFRYEFTAIFYACAKHNTLKSFNL